MTNRPQLRRLEADLGELLARQSTDRDLDTYARYRGDVVGFARGVVGFDPWEPHQRDVLEAVLEHPQVHVQGGNAVGKDAAAAVLGLYWTFVERGRVLVTSAVERQLTDVYMGEVGRLWRGSGLPGELYQKALRVPGEDYAGITTFTSTAASRLTGFHAPKVLAILSEAQAIEPFAWEGLAANATGPDDRMLAVGNPLSPQGRFYRNASATGWHTIRIPVTDHPNLRDDTDRHIPGGPSESFVDRMRQDWGEDSEQFAARIEARFPTEADEQAIPTEAIEAAFERFGRLPTKQGTDFVLGVDPSGPGADRTAVTVWRGMTAVEYHTWTRLEAPESADRILELAEKLRSGPGRHISGSNVGDIHVDEIGVGHGLVGILKRRVRDIKWRGTKVHGVNISKKPGKPERFVRRKCELIWHLREDLVEGRVALAENEMLREELRELRVRPTPNGKIEAERKQQMKTRLGGRSPDLLDSLLLATSGRVPDGKKRVWFV